MATEILNLDELSTGPEKSFQWKGKTHVMKTASVGDFIEQTRKLEETNASKSNADQLEFMIGTIRLAFPTLSEKDARAMSMPHIEAIQDLVRGKVEEAQAEGNAN